MDKLEELKAKLDRVLGKTGSTTTAAETFVEEEDTWSESTETVSTSDPLSQSPQSDDDDDLAFFKKLAEE